MAVRFLSPLPPGKSTTDFYMLISYPATLVTSVLCWIEVERFGHPCLVPEFRGKVFSFSLLNMVLAVTSVLVTHFFMLRYVPSIPTFWRVFIVNLILSNAFLCLLRWSCASYPSFCLCGISQTVLWKLNNPCVPGINHGVWSFLYSFAFDLLMFCWGFLHLYLSKILACNFLYFVVSLSGSYLNNMWWPPRMNFRVFCHLHFEGILWKA